MKCNVNLDTLKFYCEDNDITSRSMLIRNECVDSVYEFKEDNLLVYVRPDFLVIKDWQVIHEVADPVPNNTEKYWQSPLPSFHPDAFPFLVSSGKETFNLLNVQTGLMEVLVEGSARNSLC